MAIENPSGNRSSRARARSAELWGRISTAGLTVEILILAGMLVLFTFFPDRVGVFVGTGEEVHRWRFLPILGPDFSSYLPGLGLWWGFALLLKLTLLWRRRWTLALRWADLAVQGLGATILYRMASGPAILGPRPDWMRLYGWPPELWEVEAGLVAALGVAVRVGLAVAFLAVLVSTVTRLLPLVGRELGLGPLAEAAPPGRHAPAVLDLFTKDARRAYAVLDRDHRFGEEPLGGLALVVHRAKVLFHGVSAHLTPARRVLFIVCIAAAFIGRSPASLIASAGLFFLLVMELVERVTLRDELQVARQLQRDLLPVEPPVLPGYEITSSWRTANEVGGDYHDFLPTPDGRLALVVGDASGHGMAAGLLMAVASATLRAAVDLDPAPLRVLAQLHRALFRTGDRRAFMAVFYGVLSPATGRIDYACAGQPFPLLRRAGGGIVELGEGALPLGMRERLEAREATATLKPGDSLVIFSDGLAEAIAGPEGEAFGFARVRELIEPGGGPREIHDRILAAFDAHVGEEPLADDLTLVVLGRSAAATDLGEEG